MYTTVCLIFGVEPNTDVMVRCPHTFGHIVYMTSRYKKLVQGSTSLNIIFYIVLTYFHLHNPNVLLVLFIVMYYCTFRFKCASLGTKGNGTKQFMLFVR